MNTPLDRRIAQAYATIHKALYAVEKEEATRRKADKAFARMSQPKWVVRKARVHELCKRK